MPDLIDRESLLDCFESPELDIQEIIREEIANFEALEIDYCDDCIELCNNIVTACKNIIETEKAVDIERHAHWIDHGKQGCTCSHCNRHPIKDVKTSFCARCGCKMYEEQE